MAEKKQEKYTISREIQVDGKKSDIVVTVVFDTEKGRINLTSRMTTQHLSFDEVQQQAVLQQIGTQLKEGYYFGIDLMEAWLKENRPDNGQLGIFDDNGNDDMGDGGPDDEPQDEQPSKGRRKVKAIPNEE